MCHDLSCDPVDANVLVEVVRSGQIRALRHEWSLTTRAATHPGTISYEETRVVAATHEASFRELVWALTAWRDVPQQPALRRSDCFPSALARAGTLGSKSRSSTGAKRAAMEEPHPSGLRGAASGGGWRTQQNRDRSPSNSPRRGMSKVGRRCRDRRRKGPSACAPGFVRIDS
jgi:hypothetical protein